MVEHGLGLEWEDDIIGVVQSTTCQCGGDLEVTGVVRETYGGIDFGMGFMGGGRDYDIVGCRCRKCEDRYLAAFAPEQFNIDVATFIGKLKASGLMETW